MSRGSDYYQKNRERCVLVRRKYVKRNRTKIKQIQRDWYLRNREEILSKRREYRIKNIDRISQYQRQSRLTPKGKFVYYRADAKRSGREFQLTFEEFSSFWQKPCFYCGGSVETVGLDRVNNELGYIPRNVVSCCTTCNTWKHTLTQQEFLDRAKRIADMNEFRRRLL